MDDREALLRHVEADAALAGVLDVARERLDADDPGHDLAHALRVALWTVRLGGDEVDPREAIAAALLHDVVNLPKDSPERHLASERAADVAREVLAGQGFEPDSVERVASAIRTHSFSRGEEPEGPLGRALQDADRLEALGAIGIFRTVSTGVLLDARYFHAEDPWARDRPLDDAAFTVDHFFRKLLRLPATMKTDAGRREAERRATRMREFLAWLGEELGSGPPPSPQ